MEQFEYFDRVGLSIGR